MASTGRWRGYWEQVGWGQQPMHDLTLRFDDGVVSGEGRDIIGPFFFQGTMLAGGKVHLLKKYLGRHEVVYEGDYDGEGTIFGTWSIAPHWRGPFLLTLDRSDLQQESIRDAWHVEG
jgi:hypothetical protein